MSSIAGSLRMWAPRQWVIASVGAVATALLIGLPTDVIPNPMFGRPVPVTWWSIPVLVVTSLLSGLLLGTYVAGPEAEVDRPARSAGIGGAFGLGATEPAAVRRFLPGFVVAAVGRRRVRRSAKAQ